MRLPCEAIRQAARADATGCTSTLALFGANPRAGRDRRSSRYRANRPGKLECRQTHYHAGYFWRVSMKIIIVASIALLLSSAPAASFAQAVPAPISTPAQASGETAVVTVPAGWTPKPVTL